MTHTADLPQNPAWYCDDCGQPLIRAATGWVCPAQHGGIVADQLLAQRLQAKRGGSFEDWLCAVQDAAKPKRPAKVKR